MTTNDEKPKDAHTLVPAFDPKELAQQIEDEANAVTSRPPFDPLDYARAAEAFDPAFDPEAVTQKNLAVLPEPSESTETAVEVIAQPPARDPDATPPSRIPALGLALEDTAEPDALTEEIGREMYSSYLASDFPEALVLAERVLERDPAHALAQVVLDRCKERMKPAGQTLSPSSVVRLRFAELERQSKHIDARSSFVLGHVDGMTDAATVASLSGLPGPEALDRLHALLDLGVIEVVA